MRVEAMLDQHGEVVRNTTAYNAKLRRKANRRQRQEGGPAIDLAAAQKRAEHDVKLRCNLSEAVVAGLPGAAKAKRKLNDVWTNHKSKSLGDFWRP